MSNTLGAIAVARFLKIPIPKIKKAIETFQIDDYAHHPMPIM